MSRKLQSSEFLLIGNWPSNQPTDQLPIIQHPPRQGEECDLPFQIRGVFYLSGGKELDSTKTLLRRIPYNTAMKTFFDWVMVGNIQPDVHSRQGRSVQTNSNQLK